MQTPNWKIVTGAILAASLCGKVAAAAPLVPGTPPTATAQLDGAIIHQVGGFPVWSLGPYPSGFGGEARTGRPFIAARGGHHYRRYYRSYRPYYRY